MWVVLGDWVLPFLTILLFGLGIYIYYRQR